MESNRIMLASQNTLIEHSSDKFYSDVVHIGKHNEGHNICKNFGKFQKAHLGYFLAYNSFGLSISHACICSQIPLLQPHSYL